MPVFDWFSPNVLHGLTLSTAAFSGVQFEPLNGAGLFSTVVKPRASLDTPSAHIQQYPPPPLAGFYYGVPWRAATGINVFCRTEVCLARHVAP